MDYSDIRKPHSESISTTPLAEQATGLIIHKAQQLVKQLIDQRGHDRPPFLPAAFSRIVGVTKIIQADLGETSGVLLRLGSSYVIKVNQNHNLARQKFSCAHEIGHILFDELNLEPYVQTIEYRTFNPQGERNARSIARERLCDTVATELLMPEFVFRKYLSNFGLTISSIEHLASTFGVSIQAAAIRFAEVCPEPCLTLMWKPWPTGKPRGLQLGWRAGRGINSRNKIDYLPYSQSRKKVINRVNRSSSFYKAYETDIATRSVKDFKVNNTTRRLPVESKGFGYGENRYVISLAFLS